MSTYFTNFPIVSYDNVQVRDITRRTNFIQEVLSNPYVFLPYTVKEGEKPEDIAYNYYGTVQATWLVLMANNLVDPYTQWPMTSEVLDEYIIAKYQEQSGKSDRDVLYWAQDETAFDNIVYYYKRNEHGNLIRIAPDSFSYAYDVQGNIVGRNVEPGWLPFRVYEYEHALNENRREILVVERGYYEQINKEFKRIIRE